MKFNFIELIKSAFIKRDRKFRQHLWVFLVCLLISLFVWLTVKMDDEYQQVIQVPIEFINSPRSRVLVEASDSVLFVELSDKGSELLRHRYMKSQVPLKVSMRNIILSQKEGKTTGLLLTSSLFDDLGFQQDLAGKVVSISPDTLYLTFKKEISKKVPVTADLEIETQKQYMIYGNVIYNPDSVTIKGPEDAISQVTSASLGSIKYLQLKENINIVLPVKFDKQQRLLVATPGEVEVTIPVEKFTEASIQVPLTIKADSGLHFKLFPESVTVNYLIALKDYSQVSPGLFLITADFREMDIEKEKKIKVRVEEAPSTVSIKRIEPDRVEFIIIR
jgi:YbbR domain-containing protein